MSDWKTTTLAELQATPEEPMPNRAHHFQTVKRTSVTYCTCCGHMPLKNEISRLVSRLGCAYKSDSRFQTWARTRRL